MDRGEHIKRDVDIKSISIVIPARNEEETIGLVLGDLNNTIKKLKDYSFKVIVVTDHCRDRTKEIAEAKGATVIENKRSSGKGHALKTGFENAMGDVIIMMDADYSHRPEDLPKFINAINEGAGFVIGSRIFGGSDEYTRVRATGNFIFTALYGVIFNFYLSDTINGYKAFLREIIDNYDYKCANFEIEIELLTNAIRSKMRIVEVPSHERERRGGKAKSNTIIHGSKFLFQILKEGFKYHILRIQ